MTTDQQAPPTTARLGAIVGPWLDAALAKHGEGEQILWECSLMPHQESPEQPPEPMLTVFFWFPGYGPGSYLNGSFRVTNPMVVSEEEVDRTIEDFLRQLRQARAEIIAEQEQPT